ncbi:MAG: alpha/beta fold hydrolase [Pseudomonadota bacterium]
MDLESQAGRASTSVIRRVIAIAMLVAAIPAALAAAVIGVFVAASQLSVPLMIFFAGLASAALMMLLLGYVAAKVLRSARPLGFASVGSIGVPAVLGIIALTYLSPEEAAPETLRSPAVPFQLWDLDTGTRAAVRQVTSRGVTERPPIVFLHGGPGGYSVSLEATVAALGGLADDGHSIYFYDQVGGGLSTRLADITQYTLDRHLADLNAIVRRIDGGPVILVGSSFGASLAANYMARYPDHVAAAIVSGAAPMFYPHYAEIGDGKIDDVLSDSRRAKMREIVETPRVFTALALAAVNPNAAVRFAPDAELGALFDRVANEVYLPATVCPGNTVGFRSKGYGFWSNRMTGRTLSNQAYDPRPDLSNNQTPVLVIRGECDYKKADVALEYVEVIPNSRIISMAGAGHMPYLERPDAYLEHVRQFLKTTLRRGEY